MIYIVGGCGNMVSAVNLTKDDLITDTIQVFYIVFGEDRIFFLSCIIISLWGKDRGYTMVEKSGK
jgi:hypothetical protein